MRRKYPRIHQCVQPRLTDDYLFFTSALLLGFLFFSVLVSIWVFSDLFLLLLLLLHLLGLRRNSIGLYPARPDMSPMRRPTPTRVAVADPGRSYWARPVSCFLFFFDLYPFGLLLFLLCCFSYLLLFPCSLFFALFLIASSVIFSFSACSLHRIVSLGAQ